MGGWGQHLLALVIVLGPGAAAAKAEDAPADDDPLAALAERLRADILALIGANPGFLRDMLGVQADQLRAELPGEVF